MPRHEDALPSLAETPWLDRSRRAAGAGALLAAMRASPAARCAMRCSASRLRDIDIATTLSPEQVMEGGRESGFRRASDRPRAWHDHADRRQAPFEVTTLRHDVETDGRRAKVAFTADWAADAMRRDFTMNALYCDADGKIYRFCRWLRGYPEDAESGSSAACSAYPRGLSAHFALLPLPCALRKGCPGSAPGLRPVRATGAG